MDLEAVATEAEAFLREFTGRAASGVPKQTAGALLGLAGRRPKWQLMPLGLPTDRAYASQYNLERWSLKHGHVGVTLQVLRPLPYMEARGDLVSCAVLLAVARYDAAERGRCPVRLRALASAVAAEGHAVVTTGEPPVR